MNIKSKKTFTDYDFLKLLLAYLYNKKVVFITKEEIEKRLMAFYYSENFKFLFEDIAISPNSLIETPHIIIDDAYQEALAFGLIKSISNQTGEVKIMNSLDEDIAKSIIEKYSGRHKNAMDIISDYLKSSTVVNKQLINTN